MNFKKIGIIIIVIIAIFLGYVAVQPNGYTVSREIVIDAPAEKIFPHVNNSKLMGVWSPWSKLDPKAKMAMSGPEAGVGARTSWEEGEKLGTGSATVIESVPNQLVRTKLEYVKPFVMNQEADFTLKPSGNQTTVVWTVRGENNFFGRIMCTFGNMDKMVGGIFEQGLASLKAEVEKTN